MKLSILNLLLRRVVGNIKRCFILNGLHHIGIFVKLVLMNLKPINVNKGGCLHKKRWKRN